MTDELEAREAGTAPDAGAPGGVGAADADALGDGGGRTDLLDLIDRLSGLLDRTDLVELEVEAGGTGLVLRKPAALASPVVFAAAAQETPGGSPASSTGPADAGASGRPAVAERPSVKAPLTGIWYASPSPGSAPYLRVGGEVAVGQVIGLIEAMKLFNEIKSDLAGRIVRVMVENGQLVKAKQPLVELEPL